MNASRKNRLPWAVKAALVLVLAVLWLAWAPRAHAWLRGGYYYNPFTGGAFAGRAAYNPWTGGFYRGGLGYNPYTGMQYANRAFYNPYMNLYGRAAAAYNPYTGLYGYRYGYFYP